MATKVIKTRFWFDFDIDEVARPVSIGGIQDMIDSDDYRARLAEIQEEFGEIQEKAFSELGIQASTTAPNLAILIRDSLGTVSAGI